jgi:hypothetical protein
MRIFAVLIALAFSGILSATPPEITIEHDGTEVPNGSTVDVGTAEPLETLIVDFIIRNTGTGDLTISGPVTISAMGNATAVVTEQPATTPIPPGEQTSFQIEITNQGNGSFSCDVTVPSNDADETSTVFTMEATAVPDGSNGGGGGGGGGCCDDDNDGCTTGMGTGGMLMFGGLAAVGALALRQRKRLA